MKEQGRVEQSREDTIQEALSKSRETDLLFAAKAVEDAKRRYKDDPTAANAQALQSAIRLRDDLAAKSAPQVERDKDGFLKNWRKALEYIKDNGRKCEKSKFFADVRKGLLKKQPGGGFKVRDLERYMATLGMDGSPDAFVGRVEDRSRRKEEEEIRRIKALADKEEFALAVRKGQFVPKDSVHLELAARAAALEMGIKTSFEAHNLDLIAICEGNPKKSGAFLQFLSDILDRALNEYAREIEFEVVFEEDGEIEDEDTQKEN